MKILRYERGGEIGVGVLEGEAVVPLSGVRGAYPTVTSIAAGGAGALDRVREHVAGCPTRMPLAGLRLLAPIERPGKYLAIGMNYRKHAEEAAKLGIATPQKQLWFNKQTTCLAGPHDDIVRGVTEQLDYEVELGVVIGQAAKGVNAADAPAHVFGYVTANDVSARDWQFHAPTFTVGKSFDTHGPIGPWIVTADEIGDPHDLRLRTWVNDQPRQDSRTSELIFNVWDQIAYLSTAFTLEPGDLLATGTPEGVGVGMDPKTFLQPGDVVRCEVESIGAIENRVRA